jgi:hypothetical protein
MSQLLAGTVELTVIAAKVPARHVFAFSDTKV